MFLVVVAFLDHIGQYCAIFLPFGPIGFVLGLFGQISDILVLFVPFVVILGNFWTSWAICVILVKLFWAIYKHKGP